MAIILNTPWKQYADQEEKEYQTYINQPFYQAHLNIKKPSKQEWRNRKLNKEQITKKKYTPIITPIVDKINNYVGEAVYNHQTGKVPHGKHVLPLAGLAALTGGNIGAIMSAPLTTASAISTGIIGSKVVDTASKVFTGKSWAENMKDRIGLNPIAVDFTNPGMWLGGLPLLNKNYRTIMSAGDQIVKSAAKDIVHYGPVAVMRNPQGWYRPYVDQVKNGWQGWKDMQLAQRNRAIRTDINKPYFESFAKRSGKYDGKYDTKYGQIEVYDYPNYSEGIGDRVYSHFDEKGMGKMAVSQTEIMPNTYLFHIGGGGTKGSIDRASQLTLGRMRAAVPKYSYIGETTTPSTGQIGMTFVTQKGRTPTLGEMIKTSKMSKMSSATERPLSANSMNILLSGKNGQLRYTNQYMSNFNDQSLVGLNGVTRELVNNPNLSTINNFIQQSNTNARKAFVGLDGKIKMSIPINFKIK